MSAKGTIIAHVWSILAARGAVLRYDLSVMNEETPINNRHNCQESNAHNQTRKVHDVKMGGGWRPA